MGTELEGRQADNGREHAFVRRVLMGAGIIASMILILLLIWCTIRIILLIFIGILNAIFFRGISDWVSGWSRIPSKVSLTLVILFFSCVAGVGIWLLSPSIYDQVHRLSDQLPRAVQRIVEFAEKNMGLGRIEQNQKVMGGMEGIIKKAGTIFSFTLEALTDTVIIFFISLYLAFSSDTYVKGAIRLVPIGRRQKAAELMHILGDTLKGWLVGVSMMMVFVGILSGVGLWLLDIPLALSLGILAGLLTFIPYFGPIVSAVPAILTALLVDLSHAFYVTLLYLVIHMLEGYILSPLVQKRTVYLPPILTLSAIAVMSTLLGMPGLIVATPTMAIVLVLVKKIYIQGMLGDTAPSDPKASRGDETS